MNIEQLLKTHNSFIRFLIVGIINTAVGLSTIFFFLHAVHLSYWMSTFLGNTVGACFSFWLNRSFTFHSPVPFYRGLPRFFAIIYLCYVTSYFISGKLLGWMGQFLVLNTFLEQNGAVLIGSALYTVSNYLGQKYLVFNAVKTA